MIRAIKSPLTPWWLLIVGPWVALLIVASCNSGKLSQPQINRKLQQKTEQMRPYCQSQGQEPEAWLSTSNDGDITVYGRCK
jgi:hypothetical protein